MPEETPFDKYIQQLEFTPGSPEWRRMTLAERVLASLAAIMRDQVSDWLVNVVGAPSEALALYCEALEAIGASSLATDIRALAASDLDPDDFQAKLTETQRAGRSQLGRTLECCGGLCAATWM